MHCPNPTTTGLQTQMHLPPPADTRIPYRVTFVEKRYFTIDILAQSEDEAVDLGSDRSEEWLEDGHRSGCDLAKIAVCSSLDYSPVNE
jgi:hypothetical protein